MTYTVIVDKKVESFIKKQSKTTAKRITDSISNLAENPVHQVAKNFKAMIMNTG